MSRFQSVHAGGHRRDDGDQAAQQFRYGWIDQDAAIVHLGIGSRSALYRLIKEHELPYGRVGRSYRFRRADLDRWTLVRGTRALAEVR